MSNRSGALFLCAIAFFACDNEATSDTESGRAGESPGTVAATASGSAGGPVSREWAGDVTGGYQGNRISFSLDPEGSVIGDVTFEGHWDCADGIETTISGPAGSYPVEDGRIDIVSVDPPDGGATATRFVLTGQIVEAGAEGTLRVNLNALGCDTGELSWSAAPIAE